MKTALYLIPTRFIKTRTGLVPVDYRLEEHRLDLRTRFCRNRAKWRVVNLADTVAAARRYGFREFRDEEGRLVRLLSEKNAPAFFDYMQTHYGFGKDA